MLSFIMKACNETSADPVPEMEKLTWFFPDCINCYITLGEKLIWPCPTGAVYYIRGNTKMYYTPENELYKK